MPESVTGSAIAKLTVTINDALPLVAVILTVDVPVAVGVPLMTPLLSVNPAGSVPCVTS